MTPKGRIMAAAFFAAGCLSLSSGANAGPLTLINVDTHAVTCAFSTTCTVTATDSVGNFTLPGNTGTGRLQSRTYPGMAPAPGAGLLAYEYRLDLSDMKPGIVATGNCVTKLQLDFGPVVQLAYTPAGPHDVFVVATGGLGSVDLSDATQLGGPHNIAFTFSTPVCAGQSSYFFGLASKDLKPKKGKARIFYSAGGVASVDVRIP